MFDPQLYREKSEVEARRKSEPILRFEQWLQDNHMIHPDELPRLEAEIDAEIAEAVAFAEAGTWEPVEQLTRFVYADATEATGRVTP
jgi:TPP-dependent pyruvate/acetoin dehydrogenase alpha subunit